MASTFS